jgi:hypothetical protein
MTVKELYEITKNLVEQGHEDVRVLFDTEAQAYDCHMVNVDQAFYETEPTPHLALSENAPHRLKGWDTDERENDNG